MNREKGLFTDKEIDGLTLLSKVLAHPSVEVTSTLVDYTRGVFRIEYRTDEIINVTKVPITMIEALGDLVESEVVEAHAAAMGEPGFTKVEFDELPDELKEIVNKFKR